MRRYITWLLASAVVPWSGSCARSQGYEFVRGAGEASARCEQTLTAAAQRACEGAYQQSYDNYRAERRRVLEEHADK